MGLVKKHGILNQIIHIFYHLADKFLLPIFRFIVAEISV